MVIQNHKMAKTRYIKIESLCDRCKELHTADGDAGIFSLVSNVDLKQGTFDANVGMFAIHSDQELHNAITALLRDLHESHSMVVEAAIIQFLSEMAMLQDKSKTENDKQKN